MQTVLKTSGWTAFSLGLGVFGLMRSGLAGTNNYDYVSTKDVKYTGKVFNFGMFDQALVIKVAINNGIANIDAESHIHLRPIIVNIASKNE